MPTKTLAADILEYGLIALGLFLLWRFQFSASAREHRKTPGPLPERWAVSSISFIMAALCVCIGLFSASALAGFLIRVFPRLGKDESLFAIVGGSLFEICLIAGVIAGSFYLRKTDHSLQIETEPPPSPKAPVETRVVRAALITFAITVAVVYPVQWLWEQFLTLCNLPTASQEMVDLFYRTASPIRVAGLAGIAILLAPVAEELIFRGGLFRFLRGRLPRWVALVAPALIFAAMHVNFKTLEGLITLAPLTAFGLIFSLAYERTGRIVVVMIAHAVFNLHTVIFLLLGINN